MTLFNKELKERLAILEAVVDALLSLLIGKETITRGEMQIELLKRAEEREKEEEGDEDA